MFYPRACSHALAPVAALLLIVCGAAQSARALPPASASANADAGTQANTSADYEVAGASEAEEVSHDSPRASMTDFFALCRGERYDDAAKYLDLPPALEARGAELARRLKAVLDRKATLDLGKLSALPTGDTADDLPRLTDEVARVTDETGRPEPVRVARHNRDGLRWQFTQTAVLNIDGWYADLADRFVLDHFPSWLLRVGPKGLMRWQWGALPIVLATAWILGFLLSRLTAGVLRRILSHTWPSLDSHAVVRLRRPLTLCWSLAAAYLLLPWLELYGPAEAFVHAIMHVGFLVFVFWMASRLMGAFAQGLGRSPWALRNHASRSLIPLGSRVAHVALLGIGSVAVLSQLGYPVASLLAGLGVGGLAVALAAQKTLENLFGAFAIGADQPFREGDFIQTDDFSGTVEAIGLRSTKLRTADRTVITIPNGKIADLRIETLAARDRLRFACTLSLAYGTSVAQVRAVLAGLPAVLKAQPKLWPDGLTTRLLQFGQSSIDIEVSAYFATTDFSEFQRIREEVLLALMALVESAGTALAVPTRDVRLSRDATAEAQAEGADNREDGANAPRCAQRKQSSRYRDTVRIKRS